MKHFLPKALCAVLILALILISFTGCFVGDALAALGFDTHDYDGETVIATYDADSDIASELTEDIKILSVNSIDIPEFYGTKEAVEKCRDAILNYMLNTNYSKYTGNLDNLDNAAAAYPQMRFTVVIPAEEFEDIVYKYFGGKEKVQNASGEMFEYLEKIDSYVTAAQPQMNFITVNTSEIEETENTYRFTFTCSDGEETSDKYSALFIKREDDNSYFKYIKKVSEK